MKVRPTVPARISCAALSLPAVLLLLAGAAGCDTEGAAPAREQPKRATEPSTGSSSPAPPTAPPASTAPPGSSAPPSSTALPSRSVPLDTERGELRVESTGRKPRRPLRYTLRRLIRRFEIVQRMSPQLSVDGRRVPGAPAMSIEAGGALRLEAPPAPDSGARREFTIERLLPTSAALTSEDLVHLQQRFASFEGSIARDTMGPRGEPLRAETLRAETLRAETLRAELLLPSVPQPEVQDFLGRLGSGAFGIFPELPEEPLGVGARFVTERDSHEGGVRLHERTTFELVRAQGTHLWLKVTQTQRAESQPLDGAIATPGAGATAQLESLDGEMSGQLDIDSSALEQKGRLSGHLNLVTRQTTAQGHSSRSRLATQMELTVRVFTAP
ncbi:MAG TPA: hypothetical protein VLC09_20420 [Polyangiaceae bacterium]|nr:hypothetical protein [Polyangiaceae bacterium]